jgi:hypothetical protein
MLWAIFDAPDAWDISFSRLGFRRGFDKAFLLLRRCTSSQSRNDSIYLVLLEQGCDAVNVGVVNDLDSRTQSLFKFRIGLSEDQESALRA